MHLELGDNVIGYRLAELRKDRKLTQVELGKVLSVSSTTISGYENERNSPDDNLKVFLAHYFNISLDYLLGATDEEVRLDRSNILVLPQDFPDELKGELLNYATYLAAKARRKKTHLTAQAGLAANRQNT